MSHPTGTSIERTRGGGLAALATTGFLLATGCGPDGDDFMNTAFDTCNTPVTLEVVEGQSIVDKFPTHHESVQFMAEIADSTEGDFHLRCFVYTEDVDQMGLNTDSNWVEMDSLDCSTGGCDGVVTATWETTRDWELKDPWIPVACAVTSVHDYDTPTGYVLFIDEDPADAEESGIVEDCLDPNTAAQFGYGECTGDDQSTTRGDVFDVSEQTALLIASASECLGASCSSGCEEDCAPECEEDDEDSCD